MNIFRDDSFLVFDDDNFLLIKGQTKNKKTIMQMNKILVLKREREKEENYSIKKYDNEWQII